VTRRKTFVARQSTKFLSVGAGIVLGVLAGCATKAPPAASGPRRQPIAAPVRLAVLPPDQLLDSDVAAALDERLGRAQVIGAGEMVRARVSMEVAQLSLECVSASDDCYTQVGKFLQVDRLLWGQIARDPATAGLRVTVVLLDVGLGAPVGRAEGTFPQREAAIEGLQGLVDQATRVRRGPAPAGALSRSERAP
jgi:hypothetical protein